MGEGSAMQEQLPTSPGMGEGSAMQEQLPTSPGMGEGSAPKVGPLEGMQEQLPGDAAVERTGMYSQGELRKQERVSWGAACPASLFRLTDARLSNRRYRH
jgi:hypothetical protein